MDTNNRKILEMLAEKKITVEEAERLLSLMGSESGSGTRETASGAKQVKGLPKYLRVEVKPNPNNPSGPQDTVNVRVPLALIRAGMKLTSVIPPQVYDQVDTAMRDKGIDFDIRNIKPENLDELLANLNDLEVDVHSGQQIVHVYAE
jgi:hypothetical protein